MFLLCDRQTYQKYESKVTVSYLKRPVYTCGAVREVKRHRDIPEEIRRAHTKTGEESSLNISKAALNKAFFSFT